MFLYLDLLELLEARPARLQMQLARGVVEAAVVGGAGGRRCELQPAHRLVRLGAARAARVRRYHQQRLHVRAARHDACRTFNIYISSTFLRWQWYCHTTAANQR